jgi:hypothetical protein
MRVSCFQNRGFCPDVLRFSSFCDSRICPQIPHISVSHAWRLPKLAATMQKISYALFGPLFLLLATLAQAQTAGTITFTANKTSATGSLIPVLTWSTTPVATSCTASGGWSGTKFASGTETLPTITSNKSYTLTCTWGSGSTTLRWTPPTKNSNGSTLTDLAGYKVVYGRSATSLTQSKSVTDPRATSTSIGSLAAGAWYFAVRSVNSKKVESKNSTVATKTITGASAAKSLSITITPALPAYYSTSTRVYDVLFVNGGRVLGVEVGRVALGVKCNTKYPVPTGYYPVPRESVAFFRTARSTTVVTRCGPK